MKLYELEEQLQRMRDQGVTDQTDVGIAVWSHDKCRWVERSTEITKIVIETGVSTNYSRAVILEAEVD
jgi:D-ribose pyranose/furanose isomerase RbsD